MPVEAPGVRLSPLDIERFGLVIARADGLTALELPAVLDFCKSNQVQMLIARSGVEDATTTHALESASFLLMDTLVYYERDLASSPVQPGGTEEIHVLGPDDAARVEWIARECFQDYLGHYHADPRLDRDACTEVYASWARSSCENAGPDAFVLVTGSPRLEGFSTFRRTASGEGELLLGAVLPAARGKGLYRQMTMAGMFRLQESGTKRFVTSTHLGNWGAQAAWSAAGLRPFRAYHTFHRWFDRPQRSRV